MSWLLAHGIGGIRNLPIPVEVFFYGAAGVLVVSFVALAGLWRRPVLAERADGRPLPPILQRVLDSTLLRVLVGGVSFAGLVFLWLGALIGTNSSGANLTPTVVYVYFWVGMALVVVLLGNVWAAISPWKAAAEGAGWIARRLGLRDAPPLEYPQWLGRWPATVMLLLFAALELGYVNPSGPRVLALAIAIYSVLTWLGAIAFGADAWFRYGDGFSVYFGLLSRIGPLGRRDDGRLVVRTPLSGLALPDPTPGTIAFVAAMLGSTFFDGFSQTRIWQNRLYGIELDLLDQPSLYDFVITLIKVGGLVAAVAVVGSAFRLAVVGVERIGERPRLAQEFVSSLLPIALVYVIAHYFSLLLYQGEVGYRLLSDPWGRGWDLFGTRSFEPNFTFLTPHAIWYTEVAALVTGHVAGLMVAHDRAVGLFRTARLALWSQYPMLVLMVLYTVGGLWVLSQK